MTRDELKAAAVAMLDRAYIPYSHFPVGAALECSDGTVFTGCNIENAAFGPTICAERTAVAKAVSEGHRDFVRIVIAGRSRELCVPCGVCRQVLREFAPNIEIICLNGAGEERTFTLEELLPHSFGPEYCSDGSRRRGAAHPGTGAGGLLLRRGPGGAPGVGAGRGPDRKAPLPPDPSRQGRGAGPCARRFLPPVGSAHLNQNMPPVLTHRRHWLYTSFSK